MTKDEEIKILELFKKHFDKFRYNPFYGSADHFMKHGSVTGNLATEAIAFAESYASERTKELEKERDYWKSNAKANDDMHVTAHRWHTEYLKLETENTRLREALIQLLYEYKKNLERMGLSGVNDRCIWYAESALSSVEENKQNK